MEHNGVILKCLECVRVEVWGWGEEGETRKLSLNAFLSAHLRCDLRSEPRSLENEDCVDIFSEENLK